MNAKKICSGLLLFIIILFSSSVNAQEGFEATSTPSVELCPCSNQAYTVTVDNTGTTASSYRVLAGGAAAEWVAFSPDKFILNPGQKGTFSVFVNSVCNIEGDFDLDVFIATNSGLAKVIKQDLKFSECYDYSLGQGEVVDIENIEFASHDGSYLLCKNEQKTIPILITNNEDFGNSYKLVLDAPEWAGLSVDSVSLGARKSGILLINFDTTDVEGEFDFKLNAISELGEVQRKKNIGVDVAECYSLDIDLEKDNDVVCSGEDKNYDVVIGNLGALEQIVELELDAPEWADLGNISFFELESGERETATLNINPGSDVSGGFLVKVLAVVEDMERLSFSDEIQLDIIPEEACYRADISAKASINNFYTQDLFFVKVKNAGIKKVFYDVNIEGVPWASISPDSLELNPGQSGNLNLIVNPDESIEPGTYIIEINLEGNGIVYSKTVDIALKKENDFVKGLKANVKLYQYYIYLFIVILVLVFIFRRPLNKIKTKAKKRYEKYKVKRERLMALKVARKEREEEKKKKGLEEKREKQVKKIKKETRKIKLSFNRKWFYGLLIIAALIFIGHQNRLFNAKYLHIYIRNFFYGYLYYILIGAGVVAALFLILLFYNYVLKQEKNRGKVKKEIKKPGKRVKKEWYNRYYFRIIVVFLIAILIFIANNFDFFNIIKDFLVLYQYFIVLGIVILIMIISLIRFYKPLFKFLRE